MEAKWIGGPLDGTTTDWTDQMAIVGVAANVTDGPACGGCSDSGAVAVYTLRRTAETIDYVFKKLMPQEQWQPDNPEVEAMLDELDGKVQSHQPHQ